MTVNSLTSIKETLGYIDSMITSIKDDLFSNPLSLDAMFDKGEYGLYLDNPINFLLTIASRLVSREQMQGFLINLITNELPYIELGVKGVLLSNLKETIDCTNDPRIPDELRKEISVNPTKALYSNYKHGMDINVGYLDYNNIFAYSPFSSEGKNWYFGTSSAYKIYNKKTQTFKRNPTNSGDMAYPTYAEALKNCSTKDETPYSLGELTNVYELSRAKDFNAFMWFVMNKANFCNSIVVNYNNLSDYKIADYLRYNENEELISTTYDVFGSEVKNNLKHFQAKFRKTRLNSKKPFMIGNTLWQENSNVISLVIKETNEKENKNQDFLTPPSVIKEYKGSTPTYRLDNEYDGFTLPTTNVTATNYNSLCTWDFVPVSNDSYSVNWYVQPNQYYDFLSKKEDKHQRNYNKEYAICNLRFNGSIRQKKSRNWLDYKSFHFSILPKPFMHIPLFTGIRPKLITFNSDGEQAPASRNGYFTVVPYASSNTITFEDGRVLNTADLFGTDRPVPYFSKDNYNIPNENDYQHVAYYNLFFNGFNPTIKTFGLVSEVANPIVGIPQTDIGGEMYYVPPRLYIDERSGAYWLNDTAKGMVHRVLYECYPKLTVYEFNYDFIMGMRFFDPVTITSQLLSVVANCRYSRNSQFGITLSKSTTAYQMRISEIIKNMLNRDTSTVSDCFYSFSNEKYEKLEEEAELKRSNLYGFQDEEMKATHVDMDAIRKILDEYDVNASKNEQIDVLNRAFNQATANITAECLPEDKYSVELNLIVEMLKLLVNVVVETILSPKILLLLEVNRRLVGDIRDQEYTLEALFEAMIGLITAIVREIFDLIIEEIWGWVKGLLGELIAKIAKKLVLEKAVYYTALIRQLVKYYAFTVGSRENLDSILDEVNYADIIDNDEPLIDEC